MIIASNIFKCSSFLKGSTALESLSISTDSRNLSDANTFVALYGEKFDGYDFLESVIEQGIQLVIFKDELGREKDFCERFPDQEYIIVNDTILFLQDLASLHIQSWKQKGGLAIGITGSNGKTTNKEILKALLEDVFPNQVMATKGNFNNHIGLPKTIFDLNDDHNMAILEMGTSHPGEIATLARIAKPQAGFITNIGRAHLEYLINLEGVLEEKSALVKEIEKSQGLFTLNIDDPYLEKLHELKGAYTISTSKEKKPDFLWSFNKESLTFVYQGENFKVKNPNFFNHLHWQNLMNSLSLCFCLFPEKKELFLEAAQDVKLDNSNRGEVFKKDDQVFYLDAYNANPDSMRASIGMFCDYLQKENLSLEDSLLILGDMNEIGKSCEKEHQDLVKDCLKIGFQNFIFVGRYSSFYNSEKSSPSYKNVEELIKEKDQHLCRYKAVFIKGSRSVQLERLLG